MQNRRTDDIECQRCRDTGYVLGTNETLCSCVGGDLRRLAKGEVSRNVTDPWKIIGHRATLTRLDAEGNPIGEPVDVTGKISGLVVPEADMIVVDDVPLFPTKPVSVEFTMTDVDPEMLALVYGPPLLSLRRWQRWLPRSIRRRIMSRRLRRGYGG